MLVANPSRRRKERSPAQKRATERLLAWNRSHRRHAPRKTETVMTNPRRRAVAVKHHRETRHHHSYRRNPVAARRSAGSVMDVFKPALYGTGGALVVNMVTDYIPLPAMLKTPNMLLATRAALAVLLAVAGKKFMGRAASEMAVGSLTLTGVTLAQNMLGGTVHLDGLGYPSPAQNAGQQQMIGMGEYLSGSNGMGEYLSGGSFDQVY